MRAGHVYRHDITSRVRSTVEISEPFNVKVGVRQGSALPPLLFVLCMNNVSRDLQKRPPWNLLYAYDIALASETKEALQDQAQLWKNIVTEKRLKLNIGKTEYMECGLAVKKMELSKSTDNH